MLMLVFCRATRESQAAACLLSMRAHTGGAILLTADVPVI